MDFVYALINFILLALIIFLLGRKSVRRMFSERRERINAELDEAEALLGEAYGEAVERFGM